MNFVDYLNALCIIAIAVMIGFAVVNRGPMRESYLSGALVIGLIWMLMMVPA
jgi:hypothetical protein